jgi:16S rRNA (cytosine1402-N4)-methyltransferase
MHRSVLLAEAVEALNPKPGGLYFDGTLGGGGHAEALLERSGPDGRLIGMDLDVQAVERSRERLARFGERFEAVHANFADMDRVARERGIEHVDGVLLDLGVSSDQLDVGARGFGFAVEGPLDMRMDTTRGRTAADLLRDLDVEELRRILREYGEEPRAGSIARAIVRSRDRAPLVSTRQLADLIASISPRRGAIHPATRSFMGLRIAVNGELGSLPRGLAAGLDLLAVGGRLAVMAFHSLEDRIVKRFIVAHAGRQESLPQGGVAWRGERPPVRAVTPKPIVPSQQEVAANPRSRSAKLRVAERVERWGGGTVGSDATVVVRWNGTET